MYHDWTTARPTGLDPAAGLAPPHLAVGEVVLARISMPTDARCTDGGKVRPALLVAEQGKSWLVAPLTTLRAHRDGTPRVRIEQPRCAGLRGRQASYLWSSDLRRVGRIDVHGHIGWAHPPLVEAAAEHCRMTEAERAGLLAAVAREVVG